VKKDGVALALVGNKCDLKDNRDIPNEEGKKFADENNLFFAEASAKSGEGINELFQNFGEIIAVNYENKIKANSMKPPE